MKKIGIGYEDYKEFIDKNMYYVDKTLLIRDVIEKGGKVTLFTRPRRFGKTLALSMLRTFFEKEYDRDGKVVDKGRYFEGKKIMEADESILSMMGQYPVIKLSLKSAKQPTFKGAFMGIQDEIISEYDRHRYILDSDLLDDEKKAHIRGILSSSVRMSSKQYESREEEEREFENIVAKSATALKPLSEYLSLVHGRKAIILLDEYDVPLENAYFEGF